MLWGPAADGLELRRAGDGAVTLRGRFPYGVAAVLGTVGGVERREVFAARAFGGAGGEVHFLAHHDMAKPLASRGAGSLEVRDGDDALEFEARISATVASTTHGRDALALVEAGLAVGLSPGFRVRPGGDEVRRDGAAVLRTVKSAELVELSLVTRPAFPAAQIEARSWAMIIPRRRRWFA